MKQKLASYAVKTALGMVVSFTIGVMIKTERSIQTDIDAFFAAKNQ